MSPKSYYVSLLCLSLFIVACLLASFVISRSVGGDLEAENSSSRSSGGSSGQLQRQVDPLEVRTLDLVDLIECDKTFAYTRWRIQVQVPRSTPIYKQQAPQVKVISSLPDDASHRVEADEQSQGERQAIESAIRVTEVRSDEAPQGVGGETVALQPPSVGVRDGVDEDGFERYIMTNTRKFFTSSENGSKRFDQDATNSIALNDKIESKPIDTSEQMGADSRHSSQFNVGHNVVSPKQDVRMVPRSVDGGQVEPDRELESFESEKVIGNDGIGSDLSPMSRSTSEQLDFSSHEDPLQVAASELNVKQATINSTLIDCFMVDIQKRYQQKLTIEQRHKLVAVTRQVPFARMLATIKACRALSLASLSKLMQGASLEPRLAPDRRQQVSPISSTRPNSANGLQLAEGSGLQLGQLDHPSSEILLSSAATSRQNAASESLIGSFISSWLRSRGQPPDLGNNSNASVRQVRQLASGADQLAASRQPLVSEVAQSWRPDVAANNRTTTSKDDETSRASYLNMGMSMVSGIVPNTLWCGLGDRAANYSELGAEFRVDACCRAHDHCPIRIAPFAADYGLINWSMSTRSHCGCDLDFSDCLMAVNSTLSNVIKTLYFRFIGLQCVDVESTRQTSVVPPNT